MKQVEDITLTQNHIRIGTSSNPFKGTYKGKSIRGININGGDYQGVFGYNSGIIEQLEVYGEINGNNYVGGICRYNNGTISDCINNIKITCNGYNSGGICGYNNQTIIGCKNKADITGSADADSIGGICGWNEKK